MRSVFGLLSLKCCHEITTKEMVLANAEAEAEAEQEEED